jgi:hypothetical protein
LVPFFGRAEPEISEIFKTIICDVHARFEHLLSSFSLAWLDLEAFAAAVHAKGAPLTQCFGFIDGTARPISRPIVNQRIMYSGHKRVHCIKFQVCQTLCVWPARCTCTLHENSFPFSLYQCLMDLLPTCLVRWKVGDMMPSF